MKTLKERFDEKWIEDKKTGCWEWQANKDDEGYGVFWRDEKNRRAHRVSYELHTGKDPEGFLVCHKCDNRSCVNPECLFLGTHRDNMNDMIHKGRSRSCGTGHNWWQTKLQECDVRSIRGMIQRHPDLLHHRAVGTDLKKFLCHWFGVEETSIRKIAANKTWKHVKV